MAKVKQKKPKERTGVKTRYPGKVRKHPVVITMTPFGLGILNDDCERYEMSRADLIECRLRGDDPAKPTHGEPTVVT